jgi:hypothetical protein
MCRFFNSIFVFYSPILMTEKNIVKLILLHLGIGILIAIFPFLSKIYAGLIVMAGVFWIVKNRNQNHEVLYIIAYLVGSEVFLRTTGGSLCYEYGKYFMLLFTLLGLFYSGIQKKKNPYWIFLLLIFPGIFIPLESLHGDLKRKVVFDILGPVCLGVCALYTYKRKISGEQLQALLATIVLPIIACCTYLMICYPYYDGIVNNTESNIYLSGRFAPNQMATILGLGVFICFLRILLIPASKKIFVISLVVFCLIYYRGLMTFSRGGMLTSLGMTALLLFSLFLSREKYIQIKQRLVVLLVLLPTIFIAASFQTKTLLYKRYANENITGLTKSHEVNGREDMAMEEIKFFKENPVLGMGVGRTKEIRKVEYGSSISTHSEITRLLAEHGILGILSLLILIVVPLFLYLKNRQNVYLLSFFGFWLLTTNHSGMRVAAPAFIYALALLDIKLNKAKTTVEDAAGTH